MRKSAANDRNAEPDNPADRYGSESKVPGKFFTHNEALDFCVAASSFKESRLHEIMAKLLKAEIEESRKLEKITFGKLVCHLFRIATVLEEGTGKIV